MQPPIAGGAPLKAAAELIEIGGSLASANDLKRAWNLVRTSYDRRLINLESTCSAFRVCWHCRSRPGTRHGRCACKT